MSGGAQRPTLVRAISRFDLTAAIVNGVIGSAIFSMPSTQAALTGSRSPLAYFFAGLGVLTIVLCFAEVASRFQDAGGPYLYAREAFGPVVGFQAGWLTFWVRATAVAANLNAFADYAGVMAPAAAAPGGRIVVMTAVASLVAGTNLIGVRQASWTVNVFTAAKLAPLALLVVLGLPSLSSETLASQAVAKPDWTQAILLLMFAYGGFEAPLIPAGEARDPRRDSAPALLLAMGLVALVYMLVQLVVVGVLPHAADSKAPIAGAFAVLLGPPGLVVAAAAAMTSVYGYATGNALQSPRVLYAMAERGELPGAFGRIHDRFRTPYVAILVYAALSLGLAVTGSFAVNATLSAIVRLLTYGLTCAAVPVLRRKAKDALPAFAVPGAAIVAPLGVLFCLWLLSTRTFEQAGVLVAIMALGFVLRAWARRPRVV